MDAARTPDAAMSRQRTRTLLSCAAFALACLVCLAPASRRVAAKSGLKKSDAQKLIANLSLLELNKNTVSIREISTGETEATVTADVRVGVRFMRDTAGAWRASEVRVGDRQWEDFDLLARAVGTDSITRARAALDSLAAELDALARAKKQRDDEKKKKDESRAAATRPGERGAKSDERSAKKKRKDKRKSGDGQAGGDHADGNQTVGRASVGDETAAAENAADEKELVRGALRVKNPVAALSATGSSAVVEVEVSGVFDLVRDGGSWRVASVKLGGEQLRDFDSIVRALDAEKTKVARADLDTLAAALEAFKRERGFYVVANSETVLLDYLNPRYTERIVRIDPWHRPYEYEGTRDAFTLRSNGADGKPHTADDIEQRGSGR